MFIVFHRIPPGAYAFGCRDWLFAAGFTGRTVVVDWLQSTVERLLGLSNVTADDDSKRSRGWTGGVLHSHSIDQMEQDQLETKVPFSFYDSNSDMA
jgi:hypothetical protein